MRLLSYTSALLATGTLVCALGCDQQGGDSFEPVATTQPSETDTTGTGTGTGTAGATGGTQQPEIITDPDKMPIASTDANAPGPSMEGSMSLPNLMAQREYLSVLQKDSFDAADLIFGNMKMVREGQQSRTTGEIFNKSQFKQSDLMVIATFHRSDGSFINKAIAYPDSTTLEAGETTPFEIFGDWAEGIANVRLVVREFSTETRIPSFMMPRINPNQ